MHILIKKLDIGGKNKIRKLTPRVSIKDFTDIIKDTEM